MDQPERCTREEQLNLNFKKKFQKKFHQTKEQPERGARIEQPECSKEHSKEIPNQVCRGTWGATRQTDQIIAA